MAGVCHVLGCGSASPCSAHGRPAVRRERERGHSAHSRGYTARWDRFAKTFLSQYPFCGMRPNDEPPVMSRCYEQGLSIPAEVVDHVVPHRGDKALFWATKTNLQGLCMACHGRKTKAGY